MKFIKIKMRELAAYCPYRKLNISLSVRTLTYIPAMSNVINMIVVLFLARPSREAANWIRFFFQSSNDKFNLRKRGTRTGMKDSLISA